MRSQWQSRSRPSRESRPSHAAEIITTSWWLCLKNCIMKNRSPPLGVEVENIWVFDVYLGCRQETAWDAVFEVFRPFSSLCSLFTADPRKWLVPCESVFVREDLCPYCFYRSVWASHFCFPHCFPASRATSCTPQSTSCPEFPQAIPCEFEGGKNQIWMWLGPTKPSWKCKYTKNKISPNIFLLLKECCFSIIYSIVIIIMLN